MLAAVFPRSCRTRSPCPASAYIYQRTRRRPRQCSELIGVAGNLAVASIRLSILHSAKVGQKAGKRAFDGYTDPRPKLGNDDKPGTPESTRLSTKGKGTEFPNRLAADKSKAADN